MRETDKHRGAFQRTAIAAAAVCAALCGSASAIEIATGNDDVQWLWDNTIRYNLGRRIEGQEQAILRNPNFDDGDRNFGGKSLVNNRLDLLSEMDLVYQRKHGLRLSAAGWYDHAYSGNFDNTSLATSNHLANGNPATPAFGLSDYAKRYYRGPSGEMLDAFVFTSFNVGRIPLSIRAGQHTVNWGEALLGGGAIHGISYAQVPLDLAKATAVPGIEAKELFMPVPQLSATLQVMPELSFAGQYFFGWDETRVPEAGTYLGSSDLVQRGGESLVAVPGVPGLRATKGKDITPDDRGEFGLAARWSPAWLDGTMGFYYRNFSDKLPQVINRVAVVGGRPIPQQYYLAYGDDIDLYGFSLTKTVASVSLGLDLNYRKNMPLVSDASTVTSTAALPSGGDLLGARGNTWHGVFNAVGVLSSTPVYDTLTYAFELTWNHWDSVSQGMNVFKGRPGYTAIDRVAKDFVGAAINLTPTWFQVFPGGDLFLPISYSQGISGNSAVAGGGNKNTGSYSVGLGLDLYNKYRFDLKWVDYFGDITTNPATGALAIFNGTPALLEDRGAVFFTFKTTL